MNGDEQKALAELVADEVVRRMKAEVVTVDFDPTPAPPAAPGTPPPTPDELEDLKVQLDVEREQRHRLEQRVATLEAFLRDTLGYDPQEEER